MVSFALNDLYGHNHLPRAPKTPKICHLEAPKRRKNSICKPQNPQGQGQIPEERSVAISRNSKGQIPRSRSMEPKVKYKNHIVNPKYGNVFGPHILYY